MTTTKQSDHYDFWMHIASTFRMIAEMTTDPHRKQRELLRADEAESFARKHQDKEG